MDIDETTIQITDEDVLVLQREEEGMLEYRERKHDDWTDNYTLYRDKVITNRLTQRQTVNIPLMKYVLNTQLKEMMDAPQVYFNSLSNNEQKEVYYNEYWKEVLKRNKIIIKDHVDKKQNGLFGRSFKKLGLDNGKIKISLTDPQCMLVHRFVDPTDLDSSPCLTETDIYTTLDEIESNEDYIKSEVKKLKQYYTEEAGKLEAESAYNKASDKSDRLRNLGDDGAVDPILGETYVELHETYRYEWSDTYDKRVIFRYVLAVTGIGMFKLHKAELCDVIGETKDDFWHDHFPYTSWASDPEATDFWSDGVADIVRPINKVLNVWISQLSENRTLQNFGMKYYDSTDKSFVPQTFSPQPFGHYPVPGDPNKVLKDVLVGNLQGTLEEMAFIIGVAEKATGATSANSGSVETRNVTLGEVEYALANAQKRILIQQVFYSEDWKDLALKYSKFLEARGEDLEDLTVYKKGRLTNKRYKKEISLKDWKDDEGYAVEITTVQDKQDEDITGLQKQDILKAEMPDNVPLRTIRQRKMMEFSGLTPDEIAQVEEFEKQKGVNPTMPPEALAPEPMNVGAGEQGLPEMPTIQQ